MEPRKAAMAQTGQRMTLTPIEYDRARGLVADRPDTLAAVGIDSDGRLPWDKPDQLEGSEMPVVASPHVDLATWARTEPTERLIDFLANAKTEYSRGGRVMFGNRYVRAWLELRQRVQIFQEGLIEAKRLAEERERRAEERADRAEKRARASMVVAVISVLIAAITLGLRFL